MIISYFYMDKWCSLVKYSNLLHILLYRKNEILEILLLNPRNTEAFASEFLENLEEILPAK